MTAATWVLVGIILGGSVAFFIGWIIRSAIADARAADSTRRWREQLKELTDEWRTLFIELGIDHGKELAEVTDQLAKADHALADLHDQIPIVFFAGQVFQAERKDAGL
jgi:enoyl-[acyl-carrier-protein] reductase (NADH)